MPNPLTPSPEAVEAAYLTEYVSRAVVERLLTAAMPALTAQIRADVIAECVEAIQRDCGVLMRLTMLSGPADGAAWTNTAVEAVRALLPSPTPAPED